MMDQAQAQTMSLEMKFRPTATVFDARHSINIVPFITAPALDDDSETPVKVVFIVDNSYTIRPYWARVVETLRICLTKLQEAKPHCDVIVITVDTMAKVDCHEKISEVDINRLVTDLLRCKPQFIAKDIGLAFIEAQRLAADGISNLHTFLLSDGQHKGSLFETMNTSSTCSLPPPSFHMMETFEAEAMSVVKPVPEDFMEKSAVDLIVHHAPCIVRAGINAIIMGDGAPAFFTRLRKVAVGETITVGAEPCILHKVESFIARCTNVIFHDASIKLKAVIDGEETVLATSSVPIVREGDVDVAAPALTVHMPLYIPVSGNKASRQFAFRAFTDMLLEPTTHFEVSTYQKTVFLGHPIQKYELPSMRFALEKEGGVEFDTEVMCAHLRERMHNCSPDDESDVLETVSAFLEHADDECVQVQQLIAQQNLVLFRRKSGSLPKPAPLVREMRRSRARYHHVRHTGVPCHTCVATHCPGVTGGAP